MFGNGVMPVYVLRWYKYKMFSDFRPNAKNNNTSGGPLTYVNII